MLDLWCAWVVLNAAATQALRSRLATPSPIRVDAVALEFTDRVRARTRRHHRRSHLGSDRLYGSHRSHHDRLDGGLHRGRIAERADRVANIHTESGTPESGYGCQIKASYTCMRDHGPGFLTQLHAGPALGVAKILHVRHDDHWNGRIGIDGRTLSVLSGFRVSYTESQDDPLIYGHHVVAVLCIFRNAAIRDWIYLAYGSGFDANAGCIVSRYAYDSNAS